MADSRLHDGKPFQAKHELFPALWTFPERIPRQEVLAAIEQDESLKRLRFQQAAEKVARRYRDRNEETLRHLSAKERGDYYTAVHEILREIEAQEHDPSIAQAYRARSEDLGKALEGSLSQANAQIIEANARALQEVQKLAQVEKREKREEALRKFVSSIAKGKAPPADDYEEEK